LREDVILVIYIAGPITGKENRNREAFVAKECALKKLGHSVLNPTRLPVGLSEAQYMDICLAMIRAADEVHFLPGWEKSDGAIAEYHYAKKLGLDLLCAETLVVIAA
jgi:hypothetical protein